MQASGKVLLVDDDPRFIPDFVDRFSAAGYTVSVAENASAAVKTIPQGEFDVLVASDQVDGNEALQLIDELPRVAVDLEVILVTSIPDIHNAMHALQLPVAMYTVKPPVWKDLQGEVEKVVHRHRLVQAIRSAAQQRAAWHQQLAEYAQATALLPGENLLTQSTMDAIMTLAMQNAAMSLETIRAVMGGENDSSSVRTMCELLNCKRDETLTAAIYETISVLERTKSAFKSKELGVLRRKLESLVEQDVKSS